MTIEPAAFPGAATASLAWPAVAAEGLIALNVSLVLPLTFLSSTFLPANLMPPWMQELATFNPVNWALEAGRQTLSSSIGWSLVGVRLAELAARALVCAWLSIRAFRAYQRAA